jgi:adenylate kinase
MNYEIDQSDPEAYKWETIQRWLGAGSINIFGRPLAGKDTQASALSAWLHGVQLSGGQILRDAADPDVLNQIDKGLLLKQSQYLQVVTPYLSRSEYAGRPLILSSVGRWFGEQENIIAATNGSEHPMRAVVSLELNENQARERLSKLQAEGYGRRGERADDHHAALDIRLSEYAQKTEPVIDYYEQAGLLYERAEA